MSAEFAPDESLVEATAQAWLAELGGWGPHDPYARTAEYFEARSQRLIKLVEDIELQQASGKGFQHLAQTALDGWLREAELYAASAVYVRKMGGLSLRQPADEADADTHDALVAAA